MRVSALDQTKRCCLLDHGTVITCNYYKAIIAKLQSSNTILVAFAWYFVENKFSKRGAFWSARDFSFLNTYSGWTICAVQLVREYDKKDCFFVIQRFLNWLTTYAPPYQDTPNCLWSAACQIVSILTFIDRCFCKVETRACETLRSCAKRLGGLAVTTLPGASCSFNPALYRRLRRVWTQESVYLLSQIKHRLAVCLYTCFMQSTVLQIFMIVSNIAFFAITLYSLWFIMLIVIHDAHKNQT